MSVPAWPTSVCEPRSVQPERWRILGAVYPGSGLVPRWRDRAVAKGGAELANGVPLVQGVAHGAVQVDRIAVSPSGTSSKDIACGDEVGDDRLRSALGDSDALGDVAHADVGLVSDADQHMRMVGEKSPGATRSP